MYCNVQHRRGQFLNKEEKIETLEEYKKWLENEVTGINEAINKLKNDR